MNEKQELIEYLRIVEMKLGTLTQDIKNIRDRLEPKKQDNNPTFFDALRGDDHHNNRPRI